MNASGHWLALYNGNGKSPFITHLVGVDSIQMPFPINTMLMCSLKGLLCHATYNMFFRLHGKKASVDSHLGILHDCLGSCFPYLAACIFVNFVFFIHNYKSLSFFCYAIWIQNAVFSFLFYCIFFHHPPPTLIPCNIAPLLCSLHSKPILFSKEILFILNLWRIDCLFIH